MDMTILQNIIIGFVSGLAELFPVSAEAHRSLLRHLMGIASEDAVFRMIVHIAALAAVLWCSREEVYKLRRTQALLRIHPRKRRHQPDAPSVYTLRLLKTAGVFLVLGRVFTLQTMFIADALQYLTFVLVLNGILLLIPRLVRNGNKDSRNMPRSDGFIMGLCTALSVIPGFSQVGCTLSSGISRGVDRKYALKFAYLLLIPGLAVHILFDIAAIAMGGAAAFTGLGLVYALCGGVACFIGCTVAYRIMDFLSFNNNFSAFSYYCFGAGLFSFLLFLMI